MAAVRQQSSWAGIPPVLFTKRSSFPFASVRREPIGGIVAVRGDQTRTGAGHILEATAAIRETETHTGDRIAAIATTAPARTIFRPRCGGGIHR